MGLFPILKTTSSLSIFLIVLPEDGERVVGLTVELGVVLEEGLLDAVEEGFV